ncbi:MAG: gamma-glutamyl-gamma-aminobutyrate hydrolase family protein, partial [Bacilli bacterium]|nr:gamma-glutamyl-gamma-aminobutyrate hydrolase family protein [Bacilli bacterium]
MKKIGIILRPFQENKIEYLGVRRDLFSILERFPVNTIGIPITNKIEHIEEIIGECDGIILSGGNTITENDYQLVKYLYENNIPTLGICLGMQSMALTFNNNIEMKVKGHYSNEKYVHSININENSTLFKILNKNKIDVNSRH